jgi:hypothetical protein
MVRRVAVTDLGRRVVDGSLDLGQVEQASVWYSGLGAVPAGSTTVAARTAATAFAFQSSATVAGGLAGSWAFADQAAARSNAPSTAAATTIRTLISDPPRWPVTGPHLAPSVEPATGVWRRLLDARMAHRTAKEPERLSSFFTRKSTAAVDLCKALTSVRIA